MFAVWEYEADINKFISSLNFIKDVAEVVVSGDNARGWKIVRKMNSLLRNEALRLTVKFLLGRIAH